MNQRNKELKNEARNRNDRNQNHKLTVEERNFKANANNPNNKLFRKESQGSAPPEKEVSDFSESADQRAFGENMVDEDFNFNGTMEDTNGAANLDTTDRKDSETNPDVANQKLCTMG